MIILIGGEKGGTGKTTLATNIVTMMWSHSLDTLLIDTDKQGSASDWSSLRSQNVCKKEKINFCVQKFGLDLPSTVKQLNKKYEHIVIDAGGKDSVELRSAMTVADKFFIPIRPSQFDVWTLATLDSLINTAKGFNPSLKSFVVLNAVSTNPNISESKEIQETFQGFDHLTLIGATIRERVAYRKAAKSGLGVIELSLADPKACEEMKLLYNELGLQ